MREEMERSDGVWPTKKTNEEHEDEKDTRAVSGKESPVEAVLRFLPVVRPSSLPPRRIKRAHVLQRRRDAITFSGPLLYKCMTAC